MKRDILQRLFEITGNERDSLVYLKNFRSISPESFALITIDSITFSEYGESFFYDLKILQRLDLFPIILMEQSLWEYAKHFFQGSLNLNFEIDDTKLNYSEVLYDKNSNDLIKNSIQSKRIPILIYNNDLQFPVLQEIVSHLKISKMVYLLADSFFWNSQKYDSFSVIHLLNEYQKLKESGLLNSDEIQLLTDFYKLLSQNSSYLRSISITTPASLLKELFTVKGSGTLIKLGTKVELYNGMEKIDKPRLWKLLETAFHKKVKPEFLESNIDYILLESNYKGAAIMKEHKLGYILSKFAVDEIARGEGIGREIWDRMRTEFSKVFWRANPKNPINKWYVKESDGLYKFPNWFVYWIGIKPEDIPEICKYLNTIPADFYE